MKIKVFNAEGKENGTLEVSDLVFNAKVHQPLVHQVVTMYLANQRQGTAKTKGRAEVSGGGTKPFKQKGTGQARAGSNTSPVWRRGGKAFGPNPRDYYSDIPAGMRRTALRSALTIRAREEKLIVLDSINCPEPKTKTIVSLLKSLSCTSKKNLLVLSSDQQKAYLSGRNIKALTVKPCTEINAYDVLNNENIIFGSHEAIKRVEEAVTK